MKIIKITFLFFTYTLFFIGCSNDDNSNSQNPPGDNTTELIEALIEDITGGSETIWKIDTALLTNSTVTNLDVSDAFNITDDEFIFKKEVNSQNIYLEYKQGNSFNENASDTSSFLLDYYRSAENSTLSITDIESKVFANSSKVFMYNSETNITAEITFQGATLSVELSPKTAEDFLNPTTSSLSFTEIASFQSPAGIANLSSGFVGSFADNSLYIAMREGSPERVIKYNLDSNTFNENSYSQFDFVTKRLHIINNQLKVVGAQFINTYSLEVDSDPISTAHGLSDISRFGSAVVDDDIYFVGGDLSDEANANKITRYNQVTGNLEVIATMPTSKFWAESEIVDNKLYVFGGKQTFIGDSETTSYIYDLDTNTFETFNLPVPLFASFTARYENLIYVSGQVRVDTNNDGNEDDFNIYLGVYNTLDNTLTEISTDLDDSDNLSSIWGMTLFNNKLYVIYGELTTNPTWFIMSADL